MMRRTLRSSLAGLTILAPAIAWSAPPPKEATTRQEMQEAERNRAEQLAAQKEAAARAARAAADERRLASDRVAAAARLRLAESATAEVADRMEMLAERQREVRKRLNARAEAMQPLLPLIERLSLHPAETLLAVPAAPEDTLRGVLVLQGLARQVETEAEALRRDQAALEAASRAVAAEAPRLAAAQAVQAAEAADVDRQIAAAQGMKRKAETDAETASKRAADEAARAETLRAMLSTLEVQRRAEEARAREEAAQAERHKHAAEAQAARERAAALAHPTDVGSIASNAQPKGQLIAPVAGTVVRGWGEQTEAGPASGIFYTAPPSARVLAPCGGRVAFADHFRSYGLLLILDCGGGYHAVLAGFDRVDVKAGQPVQAGEPVGVMAGWEPGGTGRRPTLYVELRRDGQPVNPAPWLKSNG